MSARRSASASERATIDRALDAVVMAFARRGLRNPIADRVAVVVADPTSPMHVHLMKMDDASELSIGESTALMVIVDRDVLDAEEGISVESSDVPIVFYTGDIFTVEPLTPVSGELGATCSFCGAPGEPCATCEIADRKHREIDAKLDQLVTIADAQEGEVRIGALDSILAALGGLCRGGAPIDRRDAN